MAFSINTNLSALQSYNALAKVNSNTQKVQLRLATMKRINMVADDTSGYRVGKELESKTTVQKAELNNGSAAQNYLATAETSLEQIDSLLHDISAKYSDASDPMKDKNIIAHDINSLAEEIDSILKSTNFNGRNLLAQSNGDALASSDVFNVSGNLIVDFASDNYLKAGDLKTALHGGLLDSDTTTVLNAASDVSSLSDNVINALGRIGSLSQTLSIKMDFLASSITNNNNSISRIFDSDMATEQLNAIKGNIGVQIGTAMLSQINSSPQQLLSLFS